MFIRLKILETPEFVRAKQSMKISTAPALAVLREYKRDIVLGWGARMNDGVVFAIYAIFAVGSLVNVGDMPRTAVLAAITIAAAEHEDTIPISSKCKGRCREDEVGASGNEWEP